MDSFLPVDQLPTPSICSPVPGPVHCHLDDVLQDRAAQPAGDAGGGPQRRRGVDLQQPGSQVIGQHKVCSIQLITVLTSTTTIHHIYKQLIEMQNSKFAV